MRIIEDLNLDTMTVGELIGLLRDYDPDSPVFMQWDESGLIVPADTVDAYSEEELCVIDWQLNLGEGVEWDNSSETVVVIRAAPPVPRCETCGAILLPQEASVCDSCEGMS